jgi:hypothetical protein
VRKTLIAGVIAAACATVAVTPAQAQAQAMNWGPCASGYVCLYQDIRGEGWERAEYGPNSSDLGWMTGRASSVWNLTSSRVCFYQATTYFMFSLPPGDWIADLGWSYNDRITNYHAC